MIWNGSQMLVIAIEIWGEYLFLNMLREFEAINLNAFDTNQHVCNSILIRLIIWIDCHGLNVNMEKPKHEKL